MACEPNSNVENAGEFSCIIPPGMHAAVQSYLLAKIRGGSMDVKEILSEAKCNVSCIPPGLLPRIKTYLLCQLSNTGGETPIPPYPDCDPDAQAFLDAANITDETVAGAICVLVRDLKAYPAVGTKYWNRDILIYPFASNPGDSAAQMAVSHAVNLKSPGTYDLQFLGATPPIHTFNGVQGRLATCWADTTWVIPAGMQDDIRIMWYLEEAGTTLARYVFGTTDAAAANWFFDIWTNNAVTIRTNDATNTNGPVEKPLGLYMSQRINAGANNKQYTYPGTGWNKVTIASTGVPTKYIYIFALDSNAGGTPAGTASTFGDMKLSSLSVGSSLDSSGVGQAERDEYKLIWDNYNSTLGRGHP